MNIRANSKTTGLLLAGLATGAAAWYLLGTDNGKRTCDGLLDSLKSFSDTVKDKAGDTLADLKNKKDDLLS